MRVFTTGLAIAAVFTAAGSALADPCGMVPPVYNGPGPAITRVGAQQTYVFYKEGVESFVIRPGFKGKVEEFGMLIPFPTPPAIRKVEDDIFQHIAHAVKPPEVIVDLRYRNMRFRGARLSAPAAADQASGKSLEVQDRVRVISQEAVGMYEVAVLEAGSAKALKRWMDDKGYVYPKGMDGVTQDYVNLGWCFVAVKTKVSGKESVSPRPGMRKTSTGLPPGGTFDGNVQAMGFRFKTERLVVPMRLSAFNAGELNNTVYLLSDRPMKIDRIPEQFVAQQIPGPQLYDNLTKLLPIKVLGGDLDDITPRMLRNLKVKRDPVPKNGFARDLFAGDLEAVRRDVLSLPHEEQEKLLLRIGERLGLRGKEIDKLHHDTLLESRAKLLKRTLVAIRSMTLTVIKGNFPREVLSEDNLTFSEYVSDAAPAASFPQPRALKGKPIPAAPAPAANDAPSAPSQDPTIPTEPKAPEHKTPKPEGPALEPTPERSGSLGRWYAIGLVSLLAAFCIGLSRGGTK